MKYPRLLFVSLVIFQCLCVYTSANPAPDFQLGDLKGNTFILSNYKNKKPVFLFFWTTWCPYCYVQLEALDKSYLRLNKDGWELAAINVGEPVSRVVNFLEKRPFGFKVLLDETATVAKNYRLLGVPTYVLIDKKGNIRFKNNYFPRRELQELIAE